ncbi:hypothetical protein M8J76_003824 [Diaphorina citri]|nr:hypothetical protein M8J75_001318 [Diaphorina citri]KAI5729553.1 hypothetical protein M8J76_003824 [Diaphorina citri]KAI5734952.1 hypothetical protein M8J77_012429 [Diaphorina citri]
MPLSYEKDYPEGMCAKPDPNTLLLPDPDRKDWRVGVQIPVITGATGACLPLITNLFHRVPLYTGFYLYPVCFGLGALVGKLFEDYRANLLALQDAHYRQYIRNHPDDFQPEERKKVADLLKPWTPIR